jgi:hypothetical protein
MGYYKKNSHCFIWCDKHEIHKSKPHGWKQDLSCPKCFIEMLEKRDDLYYLQNAVSEIVNIDDG